MKTENEKRFDNIAQCVLSNFFDIPEVFNTEAENLIIFKKMLKRLNAINNEEKIVLDNIVDTLDFYYNQYYNEN